MNTSPHDGQLTAQDIEAIARHIREHIAQPVSVEALAELQGISASCFARLFKQTTGYTPHRFVLEQRVEAAKAMLMQDPATPIASVAVRTGFADQAHLTRTFQRIVGQTPGAFVAANKTATH